MIFLIVLLTFWFLIWFFTIFTFVGSKLVRALFCCYAFTPSVTFFARYLFVDSTVSFFDDLDFHWNIGWWRATTLIFAFWNWSTVILGLEWSSIFQWLSISWIVYHIETSKLGYSIHTKLKLRIDATFKIQHLPTDLILVLEQFFSWLWIILQHFRALLSFSYHSDHFCHEIDYNLR